MKEGEFPPRKAASYCGTTLYVGQIWMTPAVGRGYVLGQQTAWSLSVTVASLTVLILAQYSHLPWKASPERTLLQGYSGEARASPPLLLEQELGFGSFTVNLAVVLKVCTAVLRATSERTKLKWLNMCFDSGLCSTSAKRPSSGHRSRFLAGALSLGADAASPPPSCTIENIFILHP